MLSVPSHTANRKRTKLLVGILVFVIGLCLLPHSAAICQELHPGEIQLTLKRIERPMLEEVWVEVRISNRKTESIFVPLDGPKSATLYLRTLSIEQLRAKGGWKGVGPGCADLPPFEVFELRSGQTVTLLLELSEKIPRMCGGGKNDFRGYHRVALRYYNSLADWKDFQAWLLSPSGPRKGIPRIPFEKMPLAISHTFEIPPFREPAK